MVIADVNILLYAYDQGSEFHLSAKSWLERVLNEDEVAFSWHTITGFLRIVTLPRILKRPIPLQDAVGVVADWLNRDNTHLINFEKNNWPLFEKMLFDGKAGGNLVMDAHLAAMAVSCGALLASTDRDFTRFPNLRLIDPLKT